MKKDILGVKIDDISMVEALKRVSSWLEEGKSGQKYYIVTPNPEMLVEAQKNAEFKEALNNAELAIPDGIGLKLAGVKNRIAGVDFMEQLIQLASVRGLSLGLLGSKKGVAEKLGECLKKKYLNLKISFAEEELHSFIPKTDILFVAFGHGKQEKWIYENLPKIPVKVAMGVGGSFDYLVGDVARAPKILRKLGLEWLFRLVVQPWRIKRQFALLKYLKLIVLH